MKPRLLDSIRARNLDDIGRGHIHGWVCSRDELNQLIADVREECAQEADKWSTRPDNQTATYIAAAIREGNKST